MFDFLHIDKRNKGIILSYVFILSIVVVGYIFMVVLRTGGYQPEIYKKGYMYFNILSFLLFSIMIPLWETKGTNLKGYIKMFIEVMAFTMSSMPLTLIILTVGQINIQNILPPICIQILWGMVILSIKNRMNHTNLCSTWKAFLLSIFTFSVLVLNMIFLYFYIQYANLVITTIYDKDIISVFFLNPLLTLGGSLYTQIGGSNQMGYIPLMIYFAFWSLWIFIFAYLTCKISRQQRCKG